MKILVADDEPFIREILADVLRAQGYDVVEVADGDEALDAFGEAVFDLVVLDESMPKVKGSQVVKTLLETQEQIPRVLMVTGYQDLLGNLRQYVSILPKPFTIPVFLLAVKKTLDTPQKKISPI